MIIIGDLIPWESKALLVLLGHLAILDTAVFLLPMEMSLQISWISSEVSTFILVIRDFMTEVIRSDKTTHLKHKMFYVTEGL